MLLSSFILLTIGASMLSGAIIGSCVPVNNPIRYYVIENPIYPPNTYVLSEAAYNELNDKKFENKKVV